MRAQAKSGLAYLETALRAPRDSGWQQAGFDSFAYRLAHLSVSRSVTVVAVALLLYLA